MGDHSFTRKDRLLDAQAFSRVFDGAGCKASHKHLLMLAVNNDLGHHRLGMIIAKKNVRLAVQRNRIKRVIREFFRRCPKANETGLDVVIIARRGIDLLDNNQLSTILRQQWHTLTRSQISRST